MTLGGTVPIVLKLIGLSAVLIFLVGLIAVPSGLFAVCSKTTGLIKGG